MQGKLGGQLLGQFGRTLGQNFDVCWAPFKLDQGEHIFQLMFMVDIRAGNVEETLLKMAFSLLDLDLQNPPKTAQVMMMAARSKWHWNAAPSRTIQCKTGQFIGALRRVCTAVERSINSP